MPASCLVLSWPPADPRRAAAAGRLAARLDAAAGWAAAAAEPGLRIFARGPRPPEVSRM